MFHNPADAMFKGITMWRMCLTTPENLQCHRCVLKKLNERDTGKTEFVKMTTSSIIFKIKYIQLITLQAAYLNKYI